MECAPQQFGRRSVVVIAECGAQRVEGGTKFGLRLVLRKARIDRQLEQRWDRLHYARVAIIVAGFVLTLVAGTVA